MGIGNHLRSGSSRGADRVSNVIGIDVGGPKKGLHAVALQNGLYHDQLATTDVAEMVRWCRTLGAEVIAIDAPCGWSVDGRGRPSERALMQEKIWCFATPTRARAIQHHKGYYNWMLFGEELYQALKHTHPVVNVWPPRRERYCFETFPHAITWKLSVIKVTAKRKREQRRALLEQHGFDVALLRNIDIVDAALCALTAHMAIQGLPLTVYGEGATGFIIVPAKPST